MNKKQKQLRESIRRALSEQINEQGFPAQDELKRQIAALGQREQAAPPAWHNWMAQIYGEESVPENIGASDWFKYHFGDEENIEVRPVPSASQQEYRLYGQPRARKDGGGYNAHNAMDVGISEGTPIVSKQSGIVVALGQDISTSSGRRGYGNYIDILSQDPRTGNMVVTRYAHLKYDPAVAGLAKGQKVRAGDPLAYSGNTGGSSGAHLHIESVPAEKVIEKWGSFERRGHAGIYDRQKEQLPTEEEEEEWIRMPAAEAIDPELYPDYTYQKGHTGGSGLGREITINPALKHATDIEAPGDLNAYALDQMYGTDHYKEWDWWEQQQGSPREDSGIDYEAFAPYEYESPMIDIEGIDISHTYEPPEVHLSPSPPAERPKPGQRLKSRLGLQESTRRRFKILAGIKKK